jgi:outer membrane receptor protein involved in Fe transport
MAMYKRTLHVAALAVGAAIHGAALAQTDDSGSSPKTPSTVESIEVTTQRLDAARNSLSPDTGSSVYRIDSKDIEALPLGTSTPLDQVLLHAPGVVQDSFGQLHVRGDHANLQYRINGVVIPEPIAGFGQAFDSRFADRINFLTGALPAQYGYRTAGIVDLRTKSGALQPGGSIGYLGGSNDHHEGTADVRGSHDGFSYYFTGSYLTDDLGIENPTPEKDAIHDHTKQQKGFAYLSYVIDPSTRVSAILGSSDGKFQIPNVPGVEPTYSLAGTPPVASQDLDARQDEKNQFQVLSFQKSFGNVDYQLSLFHRYSDIHYQPDPVGDLIYNGVAAQILRKDETAGVQGDLSWQLGDKHILRTGLYWQHERFGADNTSTVFPADEDGNQTSDVPLTIVDNSHITGSLAGLYLQDEWTPSTPLTVNYGIRYDHVDTVTNEMQWSPRIGVTYDLSRDTRVHAGYARYFTPPPTEKIDTTSVQAFLGTTNALPSDANTAVRSERSDYYDLGISHQLTRDITLGADAYYRDVRHLQDEGQFGNALIFSAFNYERGKIYGLELSGTYRHEALSGYVNVGISRAMGKGIETGQFNFDPDELDYISSHWVHLDHDQIVAASGGVSYRLGVAVLSADVLYGSGLRRGFANSEHLPSYTQVNLGLTHPLAVPMIGPLDLRFAVINVFDKVYELRDGSGIGVGAPQFGPRRGFYVGISKSFG